MLHMPVCVRALLATCWLAMLYQTQSISSRASFAMFAFCHRPGRILVSRAQIRQRRFEIMHHWQCPWRRQRASSPSCSLPHVLAAAACDENDQSNSHSLCLPQTQIVKAGVVVWRTTMATGWGGRGGGRGASQPLSRSSCSCRCHSSKLN